MLFTLENQQNIKLIMVVVDVSTGFKVALEKDLKEFEDKHLFRSTFDQMDHFHVDS